MMKWFITVALSAPLSTTAFTITTSTSSADGVVEAGPTPACPADVFDRVLVTATCHQGKRFLR